MILSNPIHIMSIDDLIAIGVEILRIDNGFTSENDFIELIGINPWIVSYLIVN